jgi:hypothetical protein
MSIDGTWNGTDRDAVRDGRSRERHRRITFPEAGLRAIAATFAAPLLLLATVAYEDGPPPGHTGGFGEPTCTACHFDGPANDGEAHLAIEGLPESYEPGSSYRLRVVLSRAGMARGGFQLAARSGCEGTQAGAVEAVDGRTFVTEDGGVAYIHHTREGVSPTGADSAVWTVLWTAPSAGGPPVVFSVAANAADGDASQLGDHIYTGSRTIRPAPASSTPNP